MRGAQNAIVSFRGARWAALGLVGLAAACSSPSAGSRGAAGRSGGFAVDAGGGAPGVIIGDPDQSHDGAIQTGAGGGAGGVSDAGLPAPTPISPCRLLGIGHTLSMDLSPDGTLAAFGSAEGGITIFGVADFVARRTITAHRAPVGAVAFSPDSTRIASADASGGVALWNVADGSSVWSATPLDGAVAGLAMTQSKLWALTPNGLTAIDVANGAHGVAASVGLGAAALAVSPDGQTIALGDSDGGVRVLAAADLTVKASIPSANPGGVTSLRISGNGQKLVTGGADGTTALWDLQGTLLARVMEPGQPVASVDVNADGSLLSAGTVAQLNNIYAFKPDGTVVASYFGFTFYARVTLDGTYLIAFGGGGRAERDPLDRTQYQAFKVWEEDNSAVAFSPDGRYVAESVFDNIRLWDTDTGEMVRILDTTNPPSYTPAGGVSFSSDGAVLARNDSNGYLDVLGVADNALLAKYTGITGSNSVVYSPDGQWIATTGPAHVMFWRTSDGSTGPTGFTGSGGQAPTAVAFSPDGQTVAVGDGAGNVVCWSFPGGAMVTQFSAVPATIWHLGFSPDGTRIAVSDLNDPPALFALDGTRLPLWPEALSQRFSFSSDGAYLATLVRAPPLTQPITVNTEEHDLLLSSPATGAPAASYLWTIDIGPNQSDFFLVALPAFAPHDHRVLIGAALDAVFCLP